MAKQCDLCELPARMHCESDRASLCWECDARVHGANFLVARHSRCLLCRSCQAPTPWHAAGTRLAPTFSYCDVCLGAGNGGGGVMEKRERGDGGDLERDGEQEDEEEDDDDEEEGENEQEDEEDGDNQVVPLSTEVKTTATPPPVASCSSIEESSSWGRITACQGLLKWTHRNGDPSSSHQQDDGGRHRPQVSYRRPSPPSTAAAATPGWVRTEEPSSPSGVSFRALDDRQAETRRPPPGLVAHRVDRATPPSPRGRSPTADVLSLRSRSPPI